MQKWDFETYQKHFQDFEILTIFSETPIFQGTIHHPFFAWDAPLNLKKTSKSQVGRQDEM